MQRNRADAVLMRARFILAIFAGASILSGCSWFHSGKPDAEPQTAAVEPQHASQAQPSEPATATQTQTVSSEPLQPLTIDGPANAADRESPGSLKATHELECVSSTQLSNEYTPADLYPAMGKCVALDDTPRAVFLAAIAGVYTRFDTLRVADTTAHDAGQVLTKRATQGASEPQRKDFAQAMLGINRNAEVLAAVCSEIRRIGPPNYFPAYMIEHGMGAATANEGSVWVPDFDPDTAWQQALTGYLHCPNA